MAIYHLEAKVVSRGAGRSAVAASAYLSCTNILNDYDGVRHDFTRKKGLVWQDVFLPEFAPAEWKDRGLLWNAVEKNEKTKDSRLAREFVPALPIELTPAQWQELLTDFMGKRVKAVKPELERYVGLVQQIKDKSKERKALLAEKKERPFYQIPKLHDLTRCITELTEELEELKTEKAMLLRSLDCADDVGISAVKKEIAALESALQKLSEQEEKYSAELDEALKQYAELKEQAAGMDAVELMDARLAVREEQERSVASRVKSAYGEKYDPMMMQDSKRDVANLLNEETEARSIRERLRQKQQAQQKQNKKKSRDRWER